jgi:hypothetical protein
MLADERCPGNHLETAFLEFDLQLDQGVIVLAVTVQNHRYG